MADASGAARGQEAGGERGGALRLGMVGGGAGAFIGAVHRMAAALDGRWRLVAGAMSSTPERAVASGRALGLARVYESWQAMLAGEARLPAHERVQAVAIVTPNDTHWPIARGCIEAGLHVIIDKPMVTTLDDAVQLRALAQERGVVCCVTYTYAGYAMVERMAEIVRSGELGDVRKVMVEYHQGWLATALEQQSPQQAGQKQAAWRSDPAQAGAGGCIGDIGTHAEHLVRKVTGLRISAVAAELTTFVQGRALDDDATMLLRLAGRDGRIVARGVLSVSQVCVGEQNNLTLRVYGERGSVAWAQETPETLRVAVQDGRGVRVRLEHRGAVAESAGGGFSRLPGGHPEGFIEAFANVYRAAADAIEAGDRQGRCGFALSDADDGVAAAAFVQSAIQSSLHGGIWTGVAERGKVRGAHG